MQVDPARLGLLAVCLLCSFAFTCKHSECEPDVTRCAANVVELCDTEEEWVTVMDCSEVAGDGSVWVCCPMRDPNLGLVHTCLPETCDGE